jgi:ABC-type uncharacterized transport system permease subunit
MSIAFLGLILSSVFYLVASFLYLFSFFQSDSKSEKNSFFCVRLGFFCATLYLGSEAWTHGFAFSILNFSHVLAFFSWALAFLYLIPLARIQAQSFGLILAPVLCFLSFVAMLHSSDPAYPMNVQIYFALHIIFAFFAYASFTLSFTAATLYLIQHRELKKRHPGTFYRKLPNLETLDSLSYIPMLIGAALLACAIGVGLLWAKDTYGHYWMNDPKTWLTLLTLALYGFLIFLRFGARTRKSRLAVMGLLIFIFMIVSFAGGRQISQGNHSHASFSKTTQETP